MGKPRVVIVGCGFGGMYVAKHLRRLAQRGEIELTLISRTNYFLFTPLLHEVATGGLSPTCITEPLREVFNGSNIRICQGDVSSIDTTQKILCVGDSCNIPYDYLVLATGAETNYYNTPGAAEHTIGLKSLSDAVQMRDRIINAFEQATLTSNAERRRELLSFVVVGGGATGVELACELSEFVSQMENRYHLSLREGRDRRGTKSRLPEEATVTLVSMNPELIPTFPQPLRRLAKKRLEKMGITLRLSTTVTAVTETQLEIKDSSPILSNVTLWTAGIKPVAPNFTGQAPEQDGGRIIVDDTLRVSNDDHLFVLGDLAKTAHPQLAQVAVSQAKTVAHNLVALINKRPLQSHTFHNKGSLVSLGQWFAVGNLFSFTLHGRFTWWLWRTVYLFTFASWQKRFRIAFEWTINLFYPRDITKLS